MTLIKKLVPRFKMAIAIVFLLSLALHFWGLSRFNSLVFDEVYYVKYAYNYLTNTPLFDAHPPLGKYMIAIAISIGNYFHFGQDTVNNYVGVQLSPLSYRWMNALVGSLLPLIVGAIAYQLSRRPSYALIAALFTTCDGLLLVESRYALINIYLVFFGILGQLFFLLALQQKAFSRWVLLTASGICFGASAGVKWNGLAFLLGIYLIWICAWVMRWAQRGNPTPNPSPSTGRGARAEGQRGRGREVEWGRVTDSQSPLQNLTRINIFQIVFYLGVIPAIVYYLIWIPHLQINAKTGFWELHQQMLGFHERMQSGPKVHPYCSRWYTWPLMLRPIVYFYETATSKSEPIPSLPPLPAGAEKAIYDVHAMGNPALWWLGAIAILVLVAELGKRVWVWANISGNGEPNQVYFPQQKELWILLYVVLNYAANFLPWIKVTRCTFIYLYMGATIFTFLGLAWLVERWLHSPKPRLRMMGVTAIFLILLAFAFWLPVYLGLPLSPQAFKIRMWFPSWI
ncbi:dolichyl-phosphate-mannose--protein mannosyltransferase [Aerosakkonema sp. BLCC-F183]|uniref:dolichyl-phosphate-mannose--protein mannosyltransferase n=1 Tax=Aerosakkonema sp. BLCC-F183 TaxID=3342834 RepID=UPI0035BB1FAD